MLRTPPSSVGPSKRKLEDEFNTDEQSNDKVDNGVNKKLNMSERSDSDPNNFSTRQFERSMYEAEFRQHIIRINTLELDLKHAENEKENLNYELTVLKKKHEEEKQELIDQKHTAEMSLKSVKSNEQLLNSEIEYLRNMADNASGNLPEKDKEIKALKKSFDELTEESDAQKSKFEREIDNLKYELQSKNCELDQLQADCLKYAEASKEFNAKLDKVNKENCTLQNQLRDLESQNLKLKDNSDNLNQFIDQSKKIDTLERENRTLLSDLELLRTKQEEGLMYQEELKTKDGKIERYEKKMVQSELDIQKLKDEIEVLKQKKPETNSSTIDHFKQRIKELDSEVIKGRENYDALGETLKSLKKQLSEKNTYIDELNSNYALVNTERNCYKKMVEEFDQDKASTDSSKQLEKRCQEYEIIINQLKRSRGGELNEIQLCNNTSIQFEEDIENNIEGLTPSSSQSSSTSQISVGGSPKSDNMSENNSVTSGSQEDTVAAAASKKGASTKKTRVSKKKQLEAVITSSEVYIEKEYSFSNLPDLPLPSAIKESNIIDTAEEITKASAPEATKPGPAKVKRAGSARISKKNVPKLESEPKESLPEVTEESAPSKTDTEVMTPAVVKEEPIKPGPAKVKRAGSARISKKPVPKLESEVLPEVSEELPASQETSVTETAPKPATIRRRGSKRIQNKPAETEPTPLSQEAIQEETTKDSQPVMTKKTSRSKLKKAEVISEAQEELVIETIEEEVAEKKPKTTRSKKQSKKAEDELELKEEPEESPDPVVMKQPIKSLLKKTKPSVDLDSSLNGTKDLTKDLSGILTDDRLEDSDDSFDQDTENLVKPKAMKRPKSRMTRAEEAEWIKSERQKVVRAKLAEIQSMSDDINIDKERPTVIRFAETVEEKVIDNGLSLTAKGTPRPESRVRSVKNK